MNKFLFFLFLIFGIINTKAFADNNQKGKELNIEKTIYENKPHYIIKTKSITWYFDIEGGGFSRMIDKDGHDWISFKREPWGEYPASAASAFRGIPNLVFKSDDGGAGHPGHDKCNSWMEGEKIITESKSGKWKWSWDFFDDYALMEILKTDENQPYWFLYEGTPGGSFTPDDFYFGTSSIPVSTNIPDYYKGENIYTGYQWIFCGNVNQERTFYMIQLKMDDKTDMLGFLGNTTEGLNSPDGMTVFGFGRDKNTNPLLTGNQKFAVGFYPAKTASRKGQKAIKKYLEKTFKSE
jgi:hypothetical protein